MSTWYQSIGGVKTATFEQLKHQIRTRGLLIKTAMTDLAKCLATVKFMTEYNQVMKLQKLMYVSMDTSLNLQWYTLLGLQVYVSEWCMASVMLKGWGSKG